jgi:hypothetical protein
VDRAHIGVCRVTSGHLSHGGGKAGVEFRARDPGRVRVAALQGDDQLALHRCGADDARFGFLQRLERDAVARIRQCRVVDVRAAGDGNSPPRHRVSRISRCGAAETAHGFVVIEGIHECQPLIEPALGFLIHPRHGAGEFAKPAEVLLCGLRGQGLD